MSLLTKKRRKPEINIVPLVDVLVVLIFFFLVSMQFRNMTMLNLKLPEMETAGREKSGDHLEIAITVEGDLYLNGEKYTAEDLYTQIALIGRANPSLPVLIMADENSYLRFVTKIMDECRKAGLQSIRLQTK